MMFVMVIIIFILLTLYSNNINKINIFEIENSIKSQAECKKHGGDWNKVGLGQFNLCQIPSRDMGKYCTDG